MRLRRGVSYLLVFALGLGVGSFLLRSAIQRPLPEAEAQKRALVILDRPPRSYNIGDNQIVDAVKRIEPAVVNIDTVGHARNEEENNVPFALDPEVRGKGSGVILTQDGYIVTNNHVIEGASRIRVTLVDGRWYYARLVGTDMQTDLAVVHIDVAGLPTAELGDSDKLQVGEWSIAAGNPLGLGSTITVGVISALNRRNLQVDEGRSLDGAIQTDAAINRGNSGGALANIHGQIIGINTAILSSGPSGGSIGLGFALPINTVRRITRDIIAAGGVSSRKAHHPWIGVQLDPVPPEVALNLDLTPELGARVSHVLAETPASLAGIEDGDILLEVDGAAIHHVYDVRTILARHRRGEIVALRILRPGEKTPRRIRVRIEDRPETLSAP